MELYKLKAHELKALISNKEVKVTEVTDAFLDRINKTDDKIGAYLYKAEEEARSTAKQLDERIAKGEVLNGLGGVPVAIKDNISVKGMQNTCASKILVGYTAPYDATVTEKIKENNGIILGKLNMDEFAMGSSNENSAFKKVVNPWNENCVPGGSSGASAASVAAFEAPLSLGTETGGSVRQPASMCSVVGLKPTYGRISRYGVVAFGSTLDQVGTIGRDVEDCALLTQNIAGVDKKDFTTVDTEVQNYKNSLIKDIRGKKIGIPTEFFGEGLDDDVRKTVEDAIKVLEENGAEVKKCSLPLSEYALAAYYIISSAEASSNLARFDGIRFGHRSKEAADAVDVYFKSRSEGFGKEVKRRIMLGTYVLSAGYYDAYYKKADKFREKLRYELKKTFQKYDLIVGPVSPVLPFKIGEKNADPLAMYLADIYTINVNLAGNPAISIPSGVSKEGLPIGIQLMGDMLCEEKIFKAAYSLEQALALEL